MTGAAGLLVDFNGFGVEASVADAVFLRVAVDAVPGLDFDGGRVAFGKLEFGVGSPCLKHVAGESARGIMALTMDGIAIGNGILTVENEAQALTRARPDEKDKGGEAAKAAMALLEVKARFGG